MNIFRVMGDVSHTLSKCILIWAIHSNKSAEGVSLITQLFYLLVFTTRYLDILTMHPFLSFQSFWNFTLKIFYISSSALILFLMLKVYARTREREKAWKFGGYCLGGSFLLAPITVLIFRNGVNDYGRGPTEMLWAFSIILESVCVLPQLVLLRQTNVPTVIDSYYLVTLGSYRAFYILNWIWREEFEPYRPPDSIAVIFGIVQTLLYGDFAWVYWTRQRVKLRSGGVVDGDDLRQSWFLKRIFAHTGSSTSSSVDIEGGDGAEALNGDARPAAPRTSNWGTRGISVSADEDVLPIERERQQSVNGGSKFAGQVPQYTAADAKMKDPDELARILNDEDDDSDDDIVGSHGSGFDNGREWRDGA